MKEYVGARVPIKVWADDIEVGAFDQAKNLADLPFIPVISSWGWPGDGT